MKMSWKNVASFAAATKLNFERGLCCNTPKYFEHASHLFPGHQGIELHRALTLLQLGPKASPGIWSIGFSDNVLLSSIRLKPQGVPRAHLGQSLHTGPIPQNTIGRPHAEFMRT